MQVWVREISIFLKPSNLPMLPKRSRVSKQIIEKYLVRSRRIKTSRFLVLYTKLPGGTLPRVSFSVSKKVAPRAVTRNKLRRRGYEAVRGLLPRLSPDCVVLVSYLTADAKIPLSNMQNELKDIFVQARIYTQ